MKYLPALAFVSSLFFLSCMSSFEVCDTVAWRIDSTTTGTFASSYHTDDGFAVEFDDKGSRLAFEIPYLKTRKDTAWVDTSLTHMTYHEADGGTLYAAWRRPIPFNAPQIVRDSVEKLPGYIGRKKAYEYWILTSTRQYNGEIHIMQSCHTEQSPGD